jgi:hypothetical protein
MVKSLSWANSVPSVGFGTQLISSREAIVVVDEIAVGFGVARPNLCDNWSQKPRDAGAPNRGFHPQLGESFCAVTTLTRHRREKCANFF